MLCTELRGKALSTVLDGGESLALQAENCAPRSLMSNEEKQ